MSLEFIEGKIDDIRAEAAGVIDEYSRTQDEVSRDPNLTDTGKREHLAPIHESTSEKLKALRQQEKDVVRAKRENLERSVFGLPAGSASDPARLVSFRDAQDRANRLTDRDEAEQAYKSALRSDDSVLAQAILGQALTRGWSNVTSDYLERNPQSRADLVDLKAIREYEQNTLAASVHYSMPSLSAAVPMSVPRVSSGQLNDMFYNSPGKYR
ncbi:hypothetical protein A2J03_09860 [Rhodococcus sp. EPR-157]|uniref:hypothetical protein n=1 Tax=Rhodococcus sp. EPR-157 TaxID=1813677 RepID=UPI0007BC6672|nr:hypothetical protein [Rhodococcus sp. EPR-157]KZF00881.1 hypothetical protein A2J03_09860 [Rhodococcus sp. EPR-157]